jgi:tRNA-Thr(GGU) m(6)t(6)A37 methyltransferase TsaA
VIAVTTFQVRAIGRVESALTELDDAPRQADEGAPEAWVILDASVRDALQGVRAGDTLVLLTWLHLADRDVMVVHPRGDTSRPPTGVFRTRSPDRPNPIGLHEVEVTAVDGLRLRVRHLEAISGTPIVDIKVVLPSDVARR